MFSLGRSSISGSPIQVQSDQPAILIVDNENRLGRLVSIALQRAGYLAQTCSSAAEARQLLASGDWGLVISDIFMPQENGFELATWIGQTYPHVPTVLVTAYSTEAVMSYATQVGVAAVLQKPFSIEQLRFTINKLLAFPEPSSARWTGRVAQYQ